MKKSILLLLLACTVVAGCASSGPRSARIAEIPMYDRIYLIEESLRTDVGRSEGYGQRLGRGMKATAAGGVTGALIGTSACAATGPFFAACLVSYTAMGSGVGAVAGSLYSFSGLSRKDRKPVNEALAKIDSERDLSRELRDALRTHAPDVWTDNKSSPLHVMARLNSIELRQYIGENVEMVFEGSLTFSWIDEKDRYSAAKMNFRCVSISQDVETWIATEGSEFLRVTDDAIQTLSEQMTERILALERGEKFEDLTSR